MGNGQCILKLNKIQENKKKYQNLSKNPHKVLSNKNIFFNL